MSTRRGTQNHVFEIIGQRNSINFAAHKPFSMNKVDAQIVQQHRRATQIFQDNMGEEEFLLLLKENLYSANEN